MEYQVSASNYSAELGQAAGGVVNAVTKSGANDFHGDLFYYLRYPTWNALDSFPKSQGIYSQPIHQWQQFGGSVGGPIIKDKLFYFGTYDGSRKVNPIAYTSSSYNSTTRALALPGAGDAPRSAPAPMRSCSACWAHSRAPPIRTWFSASWITRLTPRNHVSGIVRLHELPRAQCLQHRAFVQQQLAEHQRQLHLPRAHLRGELGFDASQPTVLTICVSSGAATWKRRGPTGPRPTSAWPALTTYGENYALPRTAEPDEHRIQISDTLSISPRPPHLQDGMSISTSSMK